MAGHLQKYSDEYHEYLRESERKSEKIFKKKRPIVIFVDGYKISLTKAAIYIFCFLLVLAVVFMLSFYPKEGLFINYYAMTFISGSLFGFFVALIISIGKND